MLAVSAVLLVLVSRGRRFAVAALTVLAAAELLFQWRGLFRLSSPADLFPETPLVAFLRASPAPFRVVGAGPVLFPSTNVFAGVEDIRTHDAVERRDYLTFLDATCGYAYEYFKMIRNLDAPALDFLNVRFAVASAGSEPPGARWRLAYDGADGRLFENTRALPRAFVPERVRFVAPPSKRREPVPDANALFGGAFREIVANADWKRTAWILGGGGSETAGGEAVVSDYREETNALAFTASVASAEAWIVLSLVQDGGWTARGRVPHSGRARDPPRERALPRSAAARPAPTASGCSIARRVSRPDSPSRRRRRRSCSESLSLV